MKGEQNRITNGRLKLHSCGREIGQPEREGGREGGLGEGREGECMQKQEKTCNSNSNSNSDNTKNDSTLTLSGSLYTYSYFLPELSVRCCDCDGPDAVWPVRR